MSKEETLNTSEEEQVNTGNVNAEHESPAEEQDAMAENKEETPEKTAEEKYADLYNDYLRLFSEFDNFRKRNARERIDLLKTAGGEVMKSVLPVVDDMERAIKNFETSDAEALKQGIQLIFNKLKHSLGEKGLTEMNPVGEMFDADQHEAITQLPAPADSEKGKILDVIEKGYKLNDVVIRYPKVVVYI